MKKKTVALLCAVTMTATLVSGCGSAQSSSSTDSSVAKEESADSEEESTEEESTSDDSQESESDAKDIVIVSMNPESEPKSGFNPAANWGSGEHCHEPLIQSTLVTTDKDMNVTGDLATDFKVSEDGLTWTFTIRDDVKFTDGEPLTAQDVAFTYETVKTASTSEMDLSMLDSVIAVDDKTVEMHLNKPFNAFLYSAAVIGIVPEHAYDDNYGENPIGSGRYVLSSWEKGQQIVLEANPDYYGEAPKMKKLIVVFMEEDASLAAAKAGEVDLAYTSATYSDQEIDGYSLLDVKTVDSRGISIPTGKSGETLQDGDDVYQVGNDITSDVAIRQAMNYGVDRQAMIDNVLNGYGTIAYTAGDGMPWSSPDMKVDYDKDKATQILSDAGWVDSDGDGVVDKDGVNAEIDLYYMSTDSVRQQMANEFSNQMKDIGLQVNCVGKSWDEVYPHQYSDMVLFGWGANSPAETYNLLYSEGWGNFSQYKSDIIDGHLDKALAENDLEASYKEWQLAQWDGEDGVAPQGAATWVWFANVDHLYFERDGLKVADQKLHPHGHGWSIVNNVDRWSWE